MRREIEKFWKRHGVAKPDDGIVDAYVEALDHAGLRDPEMVRAAMDALERNQPQQYPHSAPKIVDTCRAISKSWHPAESRAMKALVAHEDAPPPRPHSDPFEDVAQFWETCPPRGKEAGSRALNDIVAMIGAEPEQRRAIADRILSRGAMT